MQDIKIINTTLADLDSIRWMFDEAVKLQGKNGYKVWESIDEDALFRDINNRAQYKVMRGEDILCAFSFQLSDPHIWRERDRNDAIYLHRIVVNPEFKGEKQFQKVLDWARRFASDNKLTSIRMDTWAENQKIIKYYESFGFRFVEYFRTPDEPALPVQNRNLNVILLELRLEEAFG